MKKAPARPKTKTSGVPNRVTISELARLIGGNRGRLVKILAAQGVERAPDKTYDRAAALDAYDAQGDHDARLGLATAGRGASPSPAISDLAAAKARSESLRSERLQIMVDQAAKKLLPREAVEGTIARFVETLKASILAVPSRVAPVIKNEKSEAVIIAALDAELRVALAYTAKVMESFRDDD